MTNAMFRFSVKWAGSNQKIASLSFAATKSPAWLNNSQLQDQVGALVNIDPQYIKLHLGSPAGPQLTPVLYTSASVRTSPRLEDLPSHKAMVAAWSSLTTTDQVFDIYVTQHSPAAIAINKMARMSRFCRFYVYTGLPVTLQRNPAVALAALDLHDLIYVRLPNELKTNKQFALAATGRAGKDTLKYFSDTLRDDEEVVLKAVARHEMEMRHASLRLQTSKTFVLDAVSVNGRCIYWVAPEFRSDKEVALAAVRQNAAAFKFLIDTLKADKDILQICNTVPTKTDHL
jgi:hypothetical protein